MKTRSNTTQGQLDKTRDDRIAALEEALHDVLTLLPAPAFVAVRFNDDGTHDDSAYKIISRAHALLGDK